MKNSQAVLLLLSQPLPAALCIKSNVQLNHMLKFIRNLERCQEIKRRGNKDKYTDIQVIKVQRLPQELDDLGGSEQRRRKPAISSQIHSLAGKSTF